MTGDQWFELCKYALGVILILGVTWIWLRD
jgi:hypothetical protein